MPREISGHMIARGLRFAIVATRWNHFITDRLVEGALDAIARHGGDADAVDIVRVPGSFELPMAANRAATTGHYDAVVCVATLIRGATPHFDYIAAEATKGIAGVALSSGIPVTYGVITSDTLEQAIERAGTKAGNKGHEAALAAIEMANLYRAMAAVAAGGDAAGGSSDRSDG